MGLQNVFPQFFLLIIIKIITRNKRIYNNPVLFKFCGCKMFWVVNPKTATLSNGLKPKIEENRGHFFNYY